MNNKCIIVLSEKSSGSSALQKLLSHDGKIKHIKKTRHYENESLFWVKAASILGLEQINMIGSEVPLSEKKAKKDLTVLINENLDDEFQNISLSKVDIFNYWELLCEKFNPIFFEKSPHHLLQWSSIKLILEATNQIKGVDFLIVGLVRNPMDVIYSHYKRWGLDPNKVQFQWLKSYNNLLKIDQIKDQFNCQFEIIKYEEIVDSKEALEPLLNFCHIKLSSIDDDYLHKNSLNKWKKDKSYGFTLSEQVIKLAKRFNYDNSDLLNNKKPFWRIRKLLVVITLSYLINIKKLFSFLKTVKNE